MTYIWQRKEWPRLSWRADALAKQLGQTRLCQGRLMSKVDALGLKRGVEATAEILAEEAVKTSAIEGERLNPESIRSSIARRLGLPAAGLQTIDRRADGLIEVLLDATTRHNKVLTPGRLKAWHAALFPTGYSGLHKIRVGKWRGPEPMRIVSGPVGRETIHFEAPPASKIEKEVRSFLIWWKESLRDTEGLIRAGIAHFRFVTIHPFEDGNGRICGSAPRARIRYARAPMSQSAATSIQYMKRPMAKTMARRGKRQMFLMNVASLMRRYPEHESRPFARPAAFPMKRKKERPPDGGLSSIKMRFLFQTLATLTWILP